MIRRAVSQALFILVAWAFLWSSILGGGLPLAHAQSSLVQPKDMVSTMLQAMTDDQLEYAAVIALELLQRYPKSKESSEARYVLGIVSIRKGQFSQARELLVEYVARGGVTTYSVRAQRLLRLLSKDDHDGKPLALFFESERCLKDSRPLKSLRLLKECLAEYPDAAISADALNSLAYVYLVSLHNYEEAFKVYTKLMEGHPDDSYTDNAIYGLGRCMELLGRKQLAREYYERLKRKHAALGAEIGGYSIPALNEYSRVWHRRASLGLNRLKMVPSKAGQGESAEFFLTGFGDRLVVESPAGSMKYQRLWRLLERDRMPVRFIEFTLNRKVDVTWENRQELLSAASLGYAPVVIFQYFDEELSPDFVKRNAERYYDFIRERLVPLLQGIHEPYILLEAEFNRGGVEKWTGWNAVAIQAINIIRAELPSAKVGLTVGDWDIAGRDTLELSMGKVASHCDFLGYQFMISSIEEKWVQDPSGQLLDRVLDFADYLSKTFNKPLFIGYLGVSSLDGWDQVQAECLESFFRHRRDLMHMGVFGMVYFSYVDDPRKSGWFGPAERLFGIVDSEGIRKPAWSVYSSNAKEIMSEEETVADVITPLAYRRQDTPSRTKPMEFSHQFSRPRFWRLTIHGKKSGALRTYQGFSRSVRVRWEGDADRGHFTAETCRANLSVIVGGMEDPVLHRVTGCEFSITNLIPPRQTVLFSEGRSSDLIVPTAWIKRTSKTYSGLQAMVLKWSDSMGGVAFPMQLKKTLLIQSGDALVLRVREDEIDSTKLSVNVSTDQGDVSFSIIPYLYRDAGKEWRNIRISRSEIVQGLLWNYGKSPELFRLNGLAFTSLSSGCLLVDDIVLEKVTQGESQIVIPYISLPPDVSESDKGKDDIGHMRFFPQR